MKKKLRRSGIKIMASLIVLLGSLSYIMVLAVINGSVGFLAAMGVTLMGAVGVAKAIDPVAITLSWGWIMGIAVGCGVLRGVLRYLEQYSNHYIAFRLLATLRDKIFGALRLLCPAKLETKKKGSIIAMITSDIETLEVFYAHTISPICIAVLVSTIVFLFVGFISSWWLALVAAISYIIIGILLPIIYSKSLKESGVNYRREFASFNAYFLDSIKGIKDIVLNNEGDIREVEVNNRSDALLKEAKKIKHGSNVQGAVTQLVVAIAIMVSLVVGIYLVHIGSLSLSYMIIGVVAIFGSFGPTIAISALPGNLTQTFASGDRVLNLLAEKPAVEPITGKNDIKYNSLEVKDLSFGYDENIVLDKVSMHASKGEIIGIIGESGCGKSTFLKLLLRFWSKKSGSIKYNDVEIENLNTDSLLENATMVLQETYLFDDTIAENLRVAKKDATMEEMIEACKMASIHDFIMTLPNGYDTPIGTLADNLSTGEKQRIGIARAFLREVSLSYLMSLQVMLIALMRVLF